MSQAAAQETKVTPFPIMQHVFAPLASQGLHTAVELDLFTLIEKGNTTLDKLHTATKASVRGLRILLNALSGLGFVTIESNSTYQLTPMASTFLVKDKPSYLGGMIMLHDQLRPAWRELTQSVKDGKSAQTAVESNEADQSFFVQLVQDIFPLSAELAKWATQLLGIEKLSGNPRVLDIGAGSAVWSLPMAQAHPKLKVTAVDRPAVLDVARRYAKQFGVSSQFEYLPGNFREIDFGKNQYDVAILGHICHMEGETHTKLLFQRLSDALKPEGKLLIADFFVDDARQHAVLPLIFGLNMLSVTEDGDTFTVSEYTKWLKEAGFASSGVFTPDEAVPPMIMITEK